MKIEADMIIEKRDLDFLLGAYLRSYLFYNQGIHPVKITIPKLLEIKSPISGATIPIEFIDYVPEEGAVEPEEALMVIEGEEKTAMSKIGGQLVDARGQLGARRDSKSSKTKHSSKHNATKPKP